MSTENQLDNYSIEEQTERLTGYCRAKGWAIEKFYTDGGFSGGNINRPAMQQLISDISAKKIDIVLVYKLDRLSRSQKDTLTLIEDVFLKNGVDFVSINENFDTSTPFGRAMIGILSVFAQLEKDQITERFTMGRIGRSKAGYFHGGGNAPTGYRYENGMLTVDDYEAAKVQEIFRLFINGSSIVGIVKEISNKYGANINATSIHNILKNSLYIGKVKFKKIEYDGLHQPIIENDIFYRAQELMKYRREEYEKIAPVKSPFRSDYFLSGLLFCSHCTARYSVVHGYYRCYSRAKSSARFVKDPNCKNDNWKVEILDELIKSEIRRLAFDSSSVDQIFESHEAPSTVDVVGLKERQAEIKEQLSRLIELYQVGGIPLEQIKSHISTLESERKGIDAMLEDSRNHLEDSKATFLEHLSHSTEILENGSLEEKRGLLRNLMSAIRIDGQHIKIEWRI